MGQNNFQLGIPRGRSRVFQNPPQDPLLSTGFRSGFLKKKWKIVENRLSELLVTFPVLWRSTPFQNSPLVFPKVAPGRFTRFLPVFTPFSTSFRLKRSWRGGPWKSIWRSKFDLFAVSSIISHFWTSCTFFRSEKPSGNDPGVGSPDCSPGLPPVCPVCLLVCPVCPLVYLLRGSVGSKNTF